MTDVTDVTVKDQHIPTLNDRTVFLKYPHVTKATTNIFLTLTPFTN